jgi:hypothetical protein
MSICLFFIANRRLKKKQPSYLLFLLKHPVQAHEQYFSRSHVCKGIQLLEGTSHEEKCCLPECNAVVSVIHRLAQKSLNRILVHILLTR